jgi:hypothetical protein
VLRPGKCLWSAIFPRMSAVDTSRHLAALQNMVAIVVQYICEPVDSGTKFIRTMRTPARPKAPTDEMIARMDDEAALGLSNIKRNVESGSSI